MTIKDTKHWASKSEAAKDEVRDFVEEAVDWIIVRRREAAWTVGGAAAVALVAGLFLYARSARINAAWDKLSQAELYAYSGRVPEAQTLLTQVAEEGGARAASTLAYMLQGDLHYPHNEFDQALTAYDKAAQGAPEPLRPYALADKVMTLQAAGRAADCAAAAQSFLDATPDHLLAAQVHTALARCQLAQGQADAAKATLQRISLQYPNTPWAEWATFRLQTPAK
ncbi:MAG: tol-pal system YbgF family protein [Elusimicrobiota bacterium]